MFEELVFQYGYVGLFIVSFLAATILPLGSEIFVVAMVVSDFNVGVVFLVATIANTLGAITNYYVGKLGTHFVMSRYVKVDSDKRRKAERIYQKWGAPVLFLSWVPVVGDLLTVVAGGFKLKLSIFTFWVFLGKSFRYFFVIKSAELIARSV
ncbi:MAG: DedA family protein [Candidatus Omnitrophica bacterium]|nr:DedA family protein [Candidatus Omnitrophota bacterium]